MFGLWLNNSSLLVAVPDDRKSRLIAHRGVHHVYAGSNRSATTCRAEHVEPITHSFIENTLPSMREAFAKGADAVEVDVHLTPDNVFAVFHDWQLDCQTDGTGVTHKQGISKLKQLDLGYGITADGQNYPLRDKGVGMMPSLDEVLDADLAGPVLINFKSNRAEEGKAMVPLLESHGLDQVFGVYGGGPPTRVAMDGVMGLRGFDRSGVLSCIKMYMVVGWSGRVPSACEIGLMPVPLNYAPLLWGWPHRFTQRLKEAGTDVILVGPYDGDGFTTGIDDAQTLARVPAGFDGYIWTNKIELIGPMIHETHAE